jgi:hypothetical protein
MIDSLDTDNADYTDSHRLLYFFVSLTCTSICQANHAGASVASLVIKKVFYETNSQLGNRFCQGHQA